jgi:hypothetical protein
VAGLILVIVAEANAAESCAALTKFTMPGHGLVIRQAREVAASAPDAKPQCQRIAVSTGLSMLASAATASLMESDSQSRFRELEWAIPVPGRRRTQWQCVCHRSARSTRVIVRRLRAASPWRALTPAIKGAVFDGSFLQDQQAALNFLYQAVPEVTVIAKQIIAQHYRRPNEHAYFVGCSRVAARR